MRHNEAVRKQVKKHVRLTDVDGSELTASIDTLRATFKVQYGDTGEAAHLVLQRPASEVRVLTRDGRNGGSLGHHRRGHPVCS